MLAFAPYPRRRRCVLNRIERPLRHVSSRTSWSLGSTRWARLKRLKNKAKWEGEGSSRARASSTQRRSVSRRLSPLPPCSCLPLLIPRALLYALTDIRHAGGLLHARRESGRERSAKGKREREEERSSSPAAASATHTLSTRLRAAAVCTHRQTRSGVSCRDTQVGVWEVGAVEWGAAANEEGRRLLAGSPPLASPLAASPAPQLASPHAHLTLLALVWCANSLSVGGASGGARTREARAGAAFAKSNPTQTPVQLAKHCTIIKSIEHIVGL